MVPCALCRMAAISAGTPRWRMRGLRLQHRHFYPEGAGDCRQFEPDKPAADDSQPTAGAQPRPDREGIIECAQRQAVIEARGHRQRARRSAGRQQQFVVSDARRVSETHAALRPLDRDDLGRRKQLDADPLEASREAIVFGVSPSHSGSSAFDSGGRS